MIFWIILFTSGARIWGQRDMGDDMFKFPTASESAYVRLLQEKNSTLKEATVCMRFYTLLISECCLFSLATKTRDNEFRLLFNRDKKTLTFSISNTKKVFSPVISRYEEWTSTCVSWSSFTGKVGVWFNEESFTHEDFQTGHVIDDDRIIIIGQDQDTYGGSFDAKQSFIGDIADVHMWDKVLTTDDIMNYRNTNGVEGDVINWKALRFELHGEANISMAPCLTV